MAKIREYLDDIGTELVNKVSWPTWKELQESSMVVLIASIVIALVILVMDLGSGWVLDSIYSLFR